MAQKVIMPLGVFYSPFLVQIEELKKGRFPICSKCKAAICQQSRKDRNMGKWICVFCGADNPFQQGFGTDVV
jgi:ribosomal protein L40E